MSFKLIIENKVFSKNDIISLDLKSIQKSYIQDILSFLHDWWSDSDTIIAQTSGSTGSPKKINLVKEKMLVSAKATGLFFKFNQNSIFCNPLPAKFIAGKMMLVRAILWDCTIHCIEPSSNPLSKIDHEYDFMVMTPHQLSTSLEDSKVKNNFIKINTILLGGSPLNKELESQIQGLDSEIYIGYGMTETMSHIALRKVNEPNKSQTYKAVSGIHFKLDSRSCLEIHTDKLLDEVLISNDIVQLKSDSEFQWLGRIDHVVNSGGIKLFPIQIEDKINAIISEKFYIAGIKDSTLGEKLVLYIQTNNWSEKQSEDLKNAFSEVLESYEIPKTIVPVENFEYTENGKLIRKTN